MAEISNSKLRIDFVYSQILNFSFQQNHIPVIKSLIITNQSDIDYEFVMVEITSDPNFTFIYKQQLTNLKKGEVYEFGAIQLSIESQFLVELTEKISGYFAISVTTVTDNLYLEHFPVDLLAYDQWSGIVSLPELLVSFIMPNHPEISKIIRRASFFLDKWTGNPSFDDYQSKNPNRVRKQMAAIYEAISELQLTYCSVPASFEESGQRIRLVDAIVHFKLANCLDLSLLYAACLEAVGINPLIIIMRGHAFVGGWLVPQTFSDSVNDDPSLITKRIAEGISEISVVEATCMNAGKIISYDEAAQSANEKMKSDDFILFIDVKRARFSTRPLPLRVLTDDGWKLEHEYQNEREGYSPTDLEVGDDTKYVDKVEVSKQSLWERKLLDLTLRNNLLNIRVTKSLIQFITINPATLEDALANGEEFQILSKPLDWENPLRDSGIYHSIHASDPILDLVKQELTQNRIRSYLSGIELNEGLTNLFRASRLALEENGANTLYVGLGLLKWYETPSSERGRYAPILLLPVEIIRKSVQKGYIIRAREEETILNITLLEMLRHDFGISIGGLESLPKDQSGIDVRKVFTIIRQAVMSQSKWDVEEQSLIGIFSFSKFILWNDIHGHADKLSKNHVVASLISGKLEWAAHEELFLPDDLDNYIIPKSINLPISYDSSQLEAVVNSLRDRSFVLHGPPGTGKSQTITNIIASALYAGKKVLFVAAKKAALEVVEERLKSIGIGSFCLELHSNKSKKSAVLQQLKEAAQVSYGKSPETYSAESERLFSVRSELNEYINALHHKYEFGYSLGDIFNLYGSLRTEMDLVYFSSETIATLTLEKLTIWNDLTKEMQTIGLQIGSPKNHPLKHIHLTQYSNSLKEKLRSNLSKLTTQLNVIITEWAPIKIILKIDQKETNRKQTESIANLVELFLKLPNIPISLFQIDSIEQTLGQVIGITEHGLKRDTYRQTLLGQFKSDVLNFPVAENMRMWEGSKNQWFLNRWIKQNSVAKRLRHLTLLGKLDKKLVPEILETISNFQKENTVIININYLPTMMGFLWNDGNCDWKELKLICDLLLQINLAAAVVENTHSTFDWRMKFSKELSEGSQSYFSIHFAEFKKFGYTYNDLVQTILEIEKIVGIIGEDISNEVKDWLNYLYSESNKWLEHIDYLKDWYTWLTMKERLIEAGLLPLCYAYEDGVIKSNEISKEFHAGFLRSAAEYIIENNSVLNSFNGRIFEEKINRFRNITQNFENLTKQELYSKLASRVPSFTQEASQSSEIGILQKNIRNNGRAMSIRRIFDDIPNLLHRLTPCMLMSPISVAQYFDVNDQTFDIVIFDEASQLPTCEAVGAIARAKQVIVVGDPKQLPPTNFFNINNTDDENIEKEDLESILDDCLALSMPSQHLLWHYRSKHESLIAFSNAKYYENKLFTFPSTDDITSKVRFVHVTGYYDKGKTRQNQAEAKAIVEEVIHRLSDSALAEKSIGIVTFSSVQQTLIEDMLNDVFAFRPDLEKVAIEAKEPIFIKNLENVQGDERDIILFSIGYGPDKEGKVSLNFGPINREGGWRRLNVAVSRARYEMKIFSTLTADQIDLARTSSEGVAGLKSFLSYAEKGLAALPSRLRRDLPTEPSFEDNLAEEIRKKGYEVNTQIGCSGYKIDIGIVNPENRNEYLLGLICDGRNYYSSRTARDREIVQPEVLSSLGWNIYRVWSTEWWEKPQKVIASIVEAIHQAKENLMKKKDVSESFQNTLAFSLPESAIYIEPKPFSYTNSTIDYQICQLEILPLSYAEEFFWSGKLGKIKEQVHQVLDVESPISRNLLCKRVLASWGISRLGSRIDAYLDSIFNNMDILQTHQKNGIIFWKGNNPVTFKSYRISRSETEKRDADDLPAEEIANGVFDLLRNQISFPKIDLIRETARLFGYARIGVNVETAMSIGIDMATTMGYAYYDNERIVIKEP